MQNFLILGLLLLVAPHCWAQSGYNYARPEVANIPTTAATNAIRPVVGGFPTGATSAYGANTNPSAFGGYSGAPTAQLGSGFTAAGIPSGPGGFTGSSAALPKRTSSLPQRTGGSIYGSAGQQQFTSTGRGGSTATGTGLDGDYEGDYSAIPGDPGVSYPIYSEVPPTNFDCAQQALPGYYSDVEAQCQVFHICALNRTYSFLCPNGTIFSQETLVCVWWNQFDCASAPSLYANNAFIYDYGSTGAPNNQVGLRQSTAFSAASTGRTPVPTATSIYGAGQVRPTVTGSNFQGISTPLTPAGGFSPTTAGRFGATPTAAAQTFPATAAPFGAVIRGGGGGSGGVSGGNAAANTAGTAAGSGFKEAAYQNAQVATASTNREYLPPPRRP